MPEVSSSLRSGSCSSVGLRNGVRSRIMQMIEKPFSAATAASRLGERLVEDLHLDIRDRPVGELQCDILIVVEDRAAVRHWLRPS